ncbi:coiled-coil domain-containing protein lost boys [Glossina fuscipes fuscipes]
MAELAAEEALEEECEEEEDEEYFEELLGNEDSTIVGRIDLAFPETIDEFADSELCYPPSYYTLSPKERLLLLYAENFRHQFIINNPNRRPLVLALPNECKVQKFVSTTIRPTAFLHVPLIRNAEECAKFVADFIIYEPLEDMMSFPTRLISPASLLRRRQGNSFEMATLLCSMLLGAGFQAFVVSGVARAETVECDLREKPYPYQMPPPKVEEEQKAKPTTGSKYKLRPLPDLRSHLEENMAELLMQKEAEEQKIKDEALQRTLEELELQPVDKYHFRRSHAWVVVLDNAPWVTVKAVHKTDASPKMLAARFFEPSTGFICETHCKQYILIDSVWNQYNYYVNKQEYQRLSEIRWDLRDTTDWEHILPGEPPEMRTYVVHSDENLADLVHPIQDEHHLDTIRSWVMKLHIGAKEFEERFPKLEKTVYYQKAKHERYSPYSQRTGKVMQLTLYSDDEYNQPTEHWEFFENRTDKLISIKYNYETSQTEENFAIGRNDSLKAMYYSDKHRGKELYFYSAPRLDSLYYLRIETDSVTLQYKERSDFCYYQLFELKANSNFLKKIVEKFHRNHNLPADKDIAVRSFLLLSHKITLKFHYARGALTASTCEFTKPPKPDYGQEIVFDLSLVKLYKANAADPDPTQLEVYRLMLAQLNYEEKIIKQFEKIVEENNQILDQRRFEHENPVLTFCIFDGLRNAAARNSRLEKKEKEDAYKRDVQTKPADFLAPYLVIYKNRALTYDESWAAYKACLSDLKSRFVFLLNDLQRQYEDLITESKSLKRFLNKFENQFNNFDYEQLVQEAKQINLNKRMVQQRLTITHEEAQKKYETVKQSLINDPRLNLIKEQEKPSEKRTSRKLRRAIKKVTTD